MIVALSESSSRVSAGGFIRWGRKTFEKQIETMTVAKASCAAHRSSASFRLPQCVCFPPGLNSRSTLQFKGLHDSDPGMHQRPTTLGRHDHALSRNLPFLIHLLCLRQLQGVVGDVLQRDQLATVRQLDRVFEWSAPAVLCHIVSNQLRTSPFYFSEQKEPNSETQNNRSRHRIRRDKFPSSCSASPDRQLRNLWQRRGAQPRAG
jgi:hypothetical protein